MGEAKRKGAYEEADDPGFDDGQVGGENGEPRHEGLSKGERVQQRRCEVYSMFSSSPGRSVLKFQRKGGDLES